MTYHRQETGFTCGPASIKNCMLAMGYRISERRIRELAGTDKNNGTDEKKLLRAIRALGFHYKQFYNKSESAFKQRIVYNLKIGNKIIILTDHEYHWISAVDYENKYIWIIDSWARNIKKELTPKELSRWCLNFSRRTKETYYYGIIIIAPRD